jgi:hypothetical protein
MRLSTLLRTTTVLGALALTPIAAHAGNSSGWTVGGGFRGGVLNPLSPSDFLPGGSHYDSGIAGAHSSIIGSGYTDPNVGSVIGSTVYSGNYSWRVEDTTFGGYASVISQRVDNYTDANIFFAWKAVLLGAHDASESATMVISLMDLTTGTEVIRREYNAAAGGGGVDPRFSLFNDNYYTAAWQIEDLTIDASSLGHDFMLTVLGSDCSPTGHWGYVYLDGFGAAPPPPSVPEPATMAVLGTGLLGLAAARRKRR